jgi:hypothetical protein
MESQRNGDAQTVTLATDAPADRRSSPVAPRTRPSVPPSLRPSICPSRRRRRRRFVPSIRLQLTLWYSTILAVSLIGFGVVLYVILDHALESEADQQLVLQAREIAGNTRVREGYEPGKFWTLLPDIDVFASPNIYVQVATLEAEVQARSGNLD